MPESFFLCHPRPDQRSVDRRIQRNMKKFCQDLRPIRQRTVSGAGPDGLPESEKLHPRHVRVVAQNQASQCGFAKLLNAVRQRAAQEGISYQKFIRRAVEGSLRTRLAPMKCKLSAREIAREMADIMVKHLETLPAQERHRKIQAGQKVIRRLKKSTFSSSSLSKSS